MIDSTQTSRSVVTPLMKGDRASSPARPTPLDLHPPLHVDYGIRMGQLYRDARLVYVLRSFQALSWEVAADTILPLVVMRGGLVKMHVPVISPGSYLRDNIASAYQVIKQPPPVNGLWLWPQLLCQFGARGPFRELDVEDLSPIHQENLTNLS